ncbi:alpha/beta fold hydrolase [Streptomyces sp. NPDC005784]|uniref:S9 family peptidase n=1 Tax=Streptomyces sp. NPDC005784 TaxID=3364731 RepID=UPI0036B4C7A4
MTEPYQVFRGALPDVCSNDPSRMVFVGDADGRCEVFTWDADTRTARQVTDRVGGTAHCAIDADAHVWWFEDDAEGNGRWWFRAFGGGPRLPGLPGAPAGQPRGLAIAPDGTVAAAVADADTTTLLVGRRGRAPRTLLRRHAPFRLAGISADGDLLALATAPGDDAAVTVLTSRGETVAVLPGRGEGEVPGPSNAGALPEDAGSGEGAALSRAERTTPSSCRERSYATPLGAGGHARADADADAGDASARTVTADTPALGRGAEGPAIPGPEDAPARPEEPSATARLWCLGFSPRPGDRDLLLVRESGRRYVLATWAPTAGATSHLWCSFDTEITARWYPDGRAVLVRQERHGRSLLHRVEPRTRRRTIVPTPVGSLLDAAPRPGGALHYVWTDTAHPPEVRATDATPLPPAGPSTVVPGHHTDLWTPVPDGRAHALLSLPERHAVVPPPAVFLVHGGPADHDRDAYDATVHSLVASGYAVVRVNYRGSTGYGPNWRRAFTDGVGHTQVRDLAAVRAELVRRRLISGDATALWGVSWGAYLVLLALGTRPGLWRAGVAVKPVADWVAAHRSTTPALRALDVRLFGGTPDEMPERYARSSPLTYAADVAAPLLVVGATKDTKCPPGQIRSYLEALERAGVPHEEMWLDTGHDGYDGAAHVSVLRRSLRFLHTHLPAAHRPAGPQRPPARLGGSRSH